MWLWQVAIIEQGVAPGGGAWLGGQLFSAMVVSAWPSSSPCLPWLHGNRKAYIIDERF